MKLFTGQRTILFCIYFPHSLLEADWNHSYFFSIPSPSQPPTTYTLAVLLKLVRERQAAAKKSIYLTICRRLTGLSRYSKNDRAAPLKYLVRRPRESAKKFRHFWPAGGIPRAGGRALALSRWWRTFADWLADDRQSPPITRAPPEQIASYKQIQFVSKWRRLEARTSLSFGWMQWKKHERKEVEGNKIGLVTTKEEV